MAILQVYQRQLEVAMQKFGDIVSEGEIIYTESKEPLKLRLNIVDGSIVDVFYSSRGKYSYHWDRRIINGTIYRHDNAPHKRWREIKTFPKHFHQETEYVAKESYISTDPLLAIEEFLEFAKSVLIENG